MTERPGDMWRHAAALVEAYACGDPASGQPVVDSSTHASMTATAAMLVREFVKLARSAGTEITPLMAQWRERAKALDAG